MENPFFRPSSFFVLDSIALCECVCWHGNESSIRDKDHFYVCHPKNHILNCEKKERKSLPPPSAHSSRSRLQHTFSLSLILHFDTWHHRRKRITGSHKNLQCSSSQFASSEDRSPTHIHLMMAKGIKLSKWEKEATQTHIKEGTIRLYSSWNSFIFFKLHIYIFLFNPPKNTQHILIAGKELFAPRANVEF